MALILLRVLVLGVIAAANDATTWSGARATLRCAVPGTQRPRLPQPPLIAEENDEVEKLYTWTHDGVGIEEWRVSPSGELVVHREEGAAGRYQCSARRPGGVLLGYPVDLEFAGMTPEFDKSPASSTAVRYQPHVLNCSIRSQPLANITWYRDGVELPYSYRYYQLPHQLLILDVQPEDEGEYKCIAENSILNKNLTSPPIKLVVGPQTVPELAFLSIEHEENISRPVHSVVYLHCPFVGPRDTEVIWHYTKDPGERKMTLDESRQVLELKLDPQQLGLYTCSIGSELTKSFNVSLSEPVTIVHPPVSREAPRSHTVRFNCTAAGEPKPEITWYKDGVPLAFGGRRNVKISADRKRLELVIGGLTSDDDGIYQCFAHNSNSVASAWASLKVTGERSEAPMTIHCRPEGPNAIRVLWDAPAGKEVLAYTLHSILQENPGIAPPGQPLSKTEELVIVNEPLTPYRFQIRAFTKETLNDKSKNVASDYSESVVCQGQGVPVSFVNHESSVTISWKEFSDDHPGVMEWILQYRTKNSTENNTVKLKGKEINYTLPVSPSDPVEVRLLGTMPPKWVTQDLTHVPWVSASSDTSQRHGTKATPVPKNLRTSNVDAKEFTIEWDCDDAELAGWIDYLVCLKMEDEFVGEDCVQSLTKSATFNQLTPRTAYTVQVQARVRNAPPAAFSAPLRVVTVPKKAQKFMNLSGQCVNASTILLSWSGEAEKYRVWYSSQLTVPVEDWNYVDTNNVFALIPNVKPSQTTYFTVYSFSTQEYSKVKSVMPPSKLDDEPDKVIYNHTSAGVGISWREGRSKVVTYVQNISKPLDEWTSVSVDSASILLSNLNPSLPTYVRVTDMKNRQQVKVLNIPPLAGASTHSSNNYLEIGLGVGTVLLVLFALAAVCLWRKRKRARSPVRSRRRVTSAEETEEGLSEMKNIGNDLANGGGARDAGEPLLNGHVHITENPTSKTPNGKIKKNRLLETMFDVSRQTDPNVTQETDVDADTSTSFNLLDTSRRTDSSRDISTHNSFTKLPDDNMNSELTRGSFQIDNSKMLPTLQPNG